MMRTNPFSPSLPVAAITRFQKQPLLQTSLSGLNATARPLVHDLHAYVPGEQLRISAHA